MGKVKLNILRPYHSSLTAGTPLWRKAKDLTEKIVASKLKRPASSVTLLKADCSSATGILYHVTFHVEGDDGVSAEYTAKVCSNICGRPHILCAFDKVPGSERKTKDSEIDDGNTSEKKMSTKRMGNQGLDLFKGLSSAVRMTTTSELECRRKDSSKLQTRAFYVLVELKYEFVNLTLKEANQEPEELELCQGEEVCFYHMEGPSGISKRYKKN